jgi:hypothetical protein
MSRDTSTHKDKDKETKVQIGLYQRQVRQRPVSNNPNLAQESTPATSTAQATPSP